LSVNDQNKGAGSVSDICLKTQKEGIVSVTLSTRFYRLSIGDQMKELEKLLARYRIQKSTWYATYNNENADSLEGSLLESLLFTIEHGVRVKKITWEIERDIEYIVRDDLKEYWLKNSC
jgi:hypothetical protein